MLRTIVLGMLAFVPLAVAASVFTAAPIIVFGLAALAIIPLAKIIGDATEALAERSGAGLGALLNATFGNAAELIIALAALHAGLIEIVKASITGSIIGNLLLVMGAAMFAGGLKNKRQTFNTTAALSAGSTMLLAVIALVIPAIFVLALPTSGASVIEHLSVAVALLMMIVYGASLFFSLKTHTHLYRGAMESAPRWSLGFSVLILVLATAAIAWMSEILVGAIEPLEFSLGWSQLFIGVVVVAVIGNAAEHSSAILVAIKNRMDLALQIALSSAAQIALFVAPLLVLVSFFFAAHFTLVFNLFEVTSIILSVLIANLVLQDGESNWLEGLQLLAAYAIVAVAFYFHP